MSDRVIAIDGMMKGALFDHQATPTIVLEMWEKWTFLATLAGSTCLFRGAVGDICAAPGGRDFTMRLFEECRAIAHAEGFRPSAPFLERSRGILTDSSSTLTASMLRDIEARAPIEADHIIGDLLNRAEMPLLRVVYIALKAYESRRSRMAAAG
jgi:2-dehydropantoate 2-reductase